MGTYIKHNGNMIDTADMPKAYLEHALNKAEAENNQNNIQVLTDELSLRTSDEHSDNLTI